MICNNMVTNNVSGITEFSLFFFCKYLNCTLHPQNQNQNNFIPEIYNISKIKITL